MAKKIQQNDFAFGISLRCAREKRGYKREQTTERAEISPRFLAAIESGRRKPSLNVLIRLVESIGASYDEIFVPQMRMQNEITSQIQRLVSQCSQRDQELILTLIDGMLDRKEKNDKK